MGGVHNSSLCIGCISVIAIVAQYFLLSAAGNVHFLLNMLAGIRMVFGGKGEFTETSVK